MTRTPTLRRALAAACALTLLLAACGGDDDDADGDEGTEETTESTAETTPEPEGSTTTGEADDPDDDDQGEDGGDTEGDPEAVATAEAINLTIDDFAPGWTEEAGDDTAGEDDFDECFTTNDIEALTVGEAETPTFTGETPDGQGAQVVAMQTVVFDSPESASAVIAELATAEFATCTQDGFVEDTEGAQAALEPLVDEQPIGEESAGVAGAVQVPGADGSTQQGRVDLHAIRTAEVVSFTLTLDLGTTPDTGFEQTLTELYTLIAQRQAAEVG